MGDRTRNFHPKLGRINVTRKHPGPDEVARGRRCQTATIAPLGTYFAVSLNPSVFAERRGRFHRPEPPAETTVTIPRKTSPQSLASTRTRQSARQFERRSANAKCCTGAAHRQNPIADKRSLGHPIAGSAFTAVVLPPVTHHRDSRLGRPPRRPSNQTTPRPPIKTTPRPPNETKRQRSPPPL